MIKLLKTAELLVNTLTQERQTLATAESCTGGMISETITAIPGSSAILKGGVVAYSNEVKEKLLSVQKNTLVEAGAVSEAVAAEMALGVKKALLATWGISTTGVAGPSGGTLQKPVGMVCFGIAGPKGIRTFTKYFSKMDRHEVRRTSTECILQALLDLI